MSTNKRGFNITVRSIGSRGDPEAAKIKDSNFHITMNTNTRLDQDVEELAPLITDIQTAANELMGDPDNLEQIVYFPFGHGSFDPETILNIDVTTRVEVGKDDAHGRRLHVHALLKIRHKSKIRLDFVKIKTEMNRLLAEKDYPHKVHYVHVEVVNNHGDRLMQYLNKT